LHSGDWLLATAVASSVLLLDEVRKVLARKMRHRPGRTRPAGSGE
jgi:hypothetical protein